jgi:predicted DNA-binding protein (MmcQ/YjbR family)
MSSRVDKKRQAVLDVALGLPEAWEDHPWGETVAKVGKKVFVFLGDDTMGVKLTEPELHEHALSLPGAQPSGYGLGKSGWVSVPLKAASLGVLRDWVEESYRVVAPKKLVARLDGDQPR